MHSDVLKFILDHGKYGIGFRVSWFGLGLLDHFAVGCILFMSCAPGQARTTDLSLWIYWLSWYWTMRSARTEGCWLNVSVLKNDCCDQSSRHQAEDLLTKGVDITQTRQTLAQTLFSWQEQELDQPCTKRRVDQDTANYWSVLKHSQPIRTRPATPSSGRDLTMEQIPTTHAALIKFQVLILHVPFILHF